MKVLISTNYGYGDYLSEELKWQHLIIDDIVIDMIWRDHLGNCHLMGNSIFAGIQQTSRLLIPPKLQIIWKFNKLDILIH